MFACIFIIVAAGGALYYIQHELIMKRTHQELQISGLGLLILFALSLIIWIYESFLGYKISSGGFNDRLIH